MAVFGTRLTLAEVQLFSGMQSLFRGDARALAFHATTGLGCFHAEKRGKVGAERPLSGSQRTLPRECMGRNWHKNSGT